MNSQSLTYERFLKATLVTAPYKSSYINIIFFKKMLVIDGAQALAIWEMKDPMYKEYLFNFGNFQHFTSINATMINFYSFFMHIHADALSMGCQASKTDHC